VTEDRDARVRALWWTTIRGISERDAKTALLQALADINEHWQKEHPEDGLPEDLGIPPDEYLTNLLDRVRRLPPAEAGPNDREG
jgi:hypothetical protein